MNTIKHVPINRGLLEKAQEKGEEYKERTGRGISVNTIMRLSLLKFLIESNQEDYISTLNKLQQQYLKYNLEGSLKELDNTEATKGVING